jgi:hypothetical protein
MQDGGMRQRTLVKVGQNYCNAVGRVKIDLGGLLQLQKAVGDAG